MKKLAILVPTLTSRKELFVRLGTEIEKQVKEIGSSAYGKIDFCWQIDSGEMTTGEKRNHLLQSAVTDGCYAISFIDDDDLPGPTYIQRALEFMESGCDCATLRGQIYWNGVPGKPFLHALQYDAATEDDKFYYRPPNHLNFMRLDLVKDIPFEEKNFGEDMTWAMKIKELGRLKTQFEISETIYHYFCGMPKHAI